MSLTNLVLLVDEKFIINCYKSIRSIYICIYILGNTQSNDDDDDDILYYPSFLI